MNGWTLAPIVGSLVILCVSVGSGSAEETKQLVKFREFMAEEVRDRLVELIRKEKYVLKGSSLADKSITVKILNRSTTKTYKEGFSFDGTGTVQKPDKRFVLSIPAIKQPSKSKLVFSVAMNAPVEVEGKAKFETIAVTVNGDVKAEAELAWTGECEATLKPKGKEYQVEVKVVKSDLRVDKLQLVKVGPWKGEEAKAVGTLIQSVFGKEVKSNIAKLEKEADKAIKAAALTARVERLAIEILLAESEDKDK